MEGYLTQDEAAAWRERLDAEGRKLVFTSGCFDILHAGHVRYLRQARALGDALVIALNSDESVRSLKGPTRPVNSEEDRAEVLLGLASVDAVVVFSGERTTSLIEAIRPHVFAKGGDYTLETLNQEERAAMEGCGAEIHILPVVEGRSTSAVLTRLAAKPDARPRLGVLGSGQGSNFAAIARSIAEGQLDAEIAIVISDEKDAPILAKATQLGLPALFIDPGPYKMKLGDPAQKELADRLQAAGVDVVVCAGFMRLLKAPVLEAFAGRILNIHPSLLPAFPGRDAPGQALAAGVTETGCTVHLVDSGMDTGAVLAQTAVPILPGDDHSSLSRRIHEAEHLLYPAALVKFLASLPPRA